MPYAVAVDGIFPAKTMDLNSLTELLAEKTTWASECQEEPIMYLMILKTQAIHLEAFQHRAAYADKLFAFKQAIWDRIVTHFAARIFCAVNAQCNIHTPCFASGD
mgnify:CR=1